METWRSWCCTGCRSCGCHAVRGSAGFGGLRSLPGEEELQGGGGLMESSGLQLQAELESFSAQPVPGVGSKDLQAGKFVYECFNDV